MKKVISLSVFNHKKHAYRPGYYWQHLKHSVWGYICLFPDYEIRIYHDESLYNNYYGGVLLRLAKAGLVKLYFMGTNPDICRAMLWRLEPLFDPEVDYLFCRDTDHSPTDREYKMHEQFINSGKLLHCIQDNESHSCHMLGGLIGFKTKDAAAKLNCKSINELLNRHSYSNKLTEHGTDQQFLNKYVWPVLKGSSAFHSIRHNGQGEIDLPRVEPTTMLDKCTPFMGTARCDFDTWYKIIRGTCDKRKIDAIDYAEKMSFIAQNFSHLNLENACTNKKRVVLATDSNISYFFFMGIVSMLWQKYMGLCPVIIIVGRIEDWLNDPIKRYALDTTRSYGAEIHFLPEIQPFKSSTVAQNARMYVSCLPMYNDDLYMMTSDMDMLPLNKAFFNKQDMNYKVHLDYANAYNYVQYPLCYVGTSVKIWREIMRPADERNIVVSLNDLFTKRDLSNEPDGMKVWCFDEHLFGERLKSWNGYKEKCQMFTRQGGPPIDRVDRSCWKDNFDINSMVDCHSVRPGHTSPNWEKIEGVLKKLVSSEDLQAINAYRWEFCTRVNRSK